MIYDSAILVGFAVRMIAFAAIIHAASDHAIGQSPAPAAILASIRENGERLRSGIYSAAGVLEHNPRKDNQESTSVEEPHIVADETIDVAFDLDQAKLHFCRLRTQMSPEQEIKFGPWNKSTLILTPDQSVQVHLNKPDGMASASIMPLVTPKSAPAYFQPVFDVRGLCLNNLKGLTMPFEELIGGFERISYEKHDEPGGIVHLTADVPVSDSPFGERFEIWVDQAQGLQPVRFAVTVGKLAELTSADRPGVKSETSWKQVHGVWVPETAEIYTRSPGWDETLRLAFTWKSVNEPVPDTWFTWKELPQGTQVADATIVDGVFVPVAVVGISQETDTGPPRPKGGELLSGKMILILVNVAAMGFVVGWMLNRGIRRRRATAAADASRLDPNGIPTLPSPQ